MNDGKYLPVRTPSATELLPLFRKFPALKAKLPYVSLAMLPTPVEKVEQLGAAIGLERLFMKRDELSGDNSAISGDSAVRRTRHAKQ